MRFGIAFEQLLQNLAFFYMKGSILQVAELEFLSRDTA